jgi:hypothetical protein
MQRNIRTEGRAGLDGKVGKTGTRTRMPRYAERNAHIGKAAMVPEVHCVDTELVLDRLEECRIIFFSIE